MESHNTNHEPRPHTEVVAGEYPGRLDVDRGPILAASAERRRRRIAGDADAPIRLGGWKASGEGAYTLPTSADRQLFGVISKLADHDDRQDLLQDHFLRRHAGHFERFDPDDRAPVETTALKRRFLDAVRKNSRLDVGLPQSRDGGQRDDLEGYWSRRATAIDELAAQRADADRLLDELCGVELDTCRLLREGFGLDEVADALELSRSQCYRVRLSVRERMGTG